MKQEKKIESTKNKIKELDCQFDIQLKLKKHKGNDRMNSYNQQNQKLVNEINT